jgi:hypothetical protein
MAWAIWIADGSRLIFHARCADRKECAVASEARHRNLALKIWITSPFGETDSWD